MLYDAPIVPKKGDLPRRFISDDYFDLYVWYRPDQCFHGFQLCYDKGGQERAVTWIMGKQPSHSTVDTGDDLPTENRSPMLTGGGYFPAAEVIAEFTRRSVHLSPKIRRLVLAKLRQLGGNGVLSLGGAEQE